MIEECDRVTARINQFLAFARPSEPQLERFDLGRARRRIGGAAGARPGRQAVDACDGLAAGSDDPCRPRDAPPGPVQPAAKRHSGLAGGRDAWKCRWSGGRTGGCGSKWRIAARACPRRPSTRCSRPYFTTRAGGTGLGLAIVRRIAAAHGWEVGYTPRPGGGAIFWLDGIHG